MMINSLKIKNWVSAFSLEGGPRSCEEVQGIEAFTCGSHSRQVGLASLESCRETDRTHFRISSEPCGLSHLSTTPLPLAEAHGNINMSSLPGHLTQLTGLGIFLEAI
jgi:hypothetical protein